MCQSELTTDQTQVERARCVSRPKLQGLRIGSSAQSSEPWSGIVLCQGHRLVWTLVWFRPDQWSPPSGKVWSESFERSFSAHEVSSAHQSDQRLLRFGMVWSEISLGWNGLIRDHFRLAPQLLLGSWLIVTLWPELLSGQNFVRSLTRLSYRYKIFNAVICVALYTRVLLVDLIKRGLCLAHQTGEWKIWVTSVSDTSNYSFRQHEDIIGTK